LHGQIAAYTSPSSACLNERLILTNTSTGATSYVWDFCQNAFLNPQSPGVSVATIPGNIPVGMEVVYDAGNWYGFVCNRDQPVSNKIVRLFFGATLSNATPTQLPDYSSSINAQLDGVSEIKFIFSNNQWFGFAVNFFSNNILRFSFGSSLTNDNPAILDLGNPGGLIGLYGLDIAKKNGEIILAATGYSSNSISFINYSNTIAMAAPVVAEVNTITSATSSLLISPVKIGVQENNNNWFALVSSLAGKIVLIDLGLDPMALPTTISSVADIPSASSLQFKKDGLNYFAFVRNNTGSLFRMNFGTTVSTLPDISVLGNFGETGAVYGMSIVKDWPDWKAFSVGVFSNKISRVDFKDNGTSDVTISSTNLVAPQNVSFLTPGDKVIELAAFDATLKMDMIQSTVVVAGIQAPQLFFTTNNACVGQPGQFSAFATSATPLSNTNWDFGNGNLATGNTTTFQYSTPGSFSVSLTSTAGNGCSNFFEGSVSIFNSPIASFMLPQNSPLCTNQELQFINNTVYDVGSSPLWQWSVNGTIVSTTKDLVAAFSNTISQNITLAVGIPGCSSQFSSLLPITQQGPLVNFMVPSITCQDSSLNFLNTTSGTVDTFMWSFGDGNTSAAVNASNSYFSVGTYNVTLQANNAAGCQNSLTKQITIYSTPQPDFSIGLPPFSCAGSSSQFTDLTPAPTDSNITNWTWGFGDAANGSSLVKNPSYTYTTANTYNVSLAVATNFGCTNSIQKAVTISPSPVAGFSNLPACVNQATQFTDASSGIIESRLWQIQSSTFTTPSPQFIFPSAGSFPVVLTVTGNNNCVSQASKNIVVPVVPSLDFSVQAPCANSPTVFTELTTSVDPSISKSWSFGSQGTGSGSPVQYTFSSTSTYAVQLNSTRQSGCVYSVSKNVSIVSPPVADFVPSIDAGAAPLPVSFTNNSSGANSYLWKFGDPGNSTSVLVSPTFVFSELGSYNVELSASNSLGCTNRLSKPISVVVPNVDAEMTDFFFVKDPKTGSLQPVVRLLNRSNITLTNPIILLDVAGGSGVSQQLTGAIKPNQEVSQMLDLKLVPKTNQYVCAEVVVAGDVDTFLNRKCLSLSGEEVLFAPFPNPAREQLNMDWISIDGSAVTFQVLTSAGAVSFQQTISSINPGLNRLVINTSTLLSGTYFIRFRDRTNDRTFSLVVLGN
jgi:PKD repeat protein